MRKRKNKQEEEKVFWCFYCTKVCSDENGLVLHQVRPRAGPGGRRLPSPPAASGHLLLPMPLRSAVPSLTHLLA